MAPPTVDAASSGVPEARAAARSAPSPPGQRLHFGCGGGASALTADVVPLGSHRPQEWCHATPTTRPSGSRLTGKQALTCTDAVDMPWICRTACVPTHISA